jgi:hypothetical protein
MSPWVARSLTKTISPPMERKKCRSSAKRQGPAWGGHRPSGRVLTSQLPIKLGIRRWEAMISDAICDRLVHNAYQVTTAHRLNAPPRAQGANTDCVRRVDPTRRGLCPRVRSGCVVAPNTQRYGTMRGTAYATKRSSAGTAKAATTQCPSILGAQRVRHVSCDRRHNNGAAFPESDDMTVAIDGYAHAFHRKGSALRGSRSARHGIQGRRIQPFETGRPPREL